MARKTTRRRRPRRRPNVPPPGGSPPAPAAARTAAPNAARGGGASAPSALADENLGQTYRHVAVDLRRILVLGVVMFALIAGAKVMADMYGSSFVLDMIR